MTSFTETLSIETIAARTHSGHMATAEEREALESCIVDFLRDDLHIFGVKASDRMAVAFFEACGVDMDALNETYTHLVLCEDFANSTRGKN